MTGILLLTPGSAGAQEGGRKKDRTTMVASASTSVSATMAVSVFTSAEKRALTDYFGRHPAGAKPLPPGIAKNLARGKPLPPGIARTRLPARAEDAMPPRKDGSQITIFGDRIVLLEASGLVVDVLTGILD
jgi:hypothetical protein